jgi:hypothetical protein
MPDRRQSRDLVTELHDDTAVDESGTIDVCNPHPVDEDRDAV